MIKSSLTPRKKKNDDDISKRGILFSFMRQNLFPFLKVEKESEAKKIGAILGSLICIGIPNIWKMEINFEIGTRNPENPGNW
jgi:hypothetical protein